jgi:hypothetical protein
MIRTKAKPKRRAKAFYTYPPVTLDRAGMLQRSVAEGTANAEEAREHRRAMNILRAKFLNGALSRENARRLGIT